MAGRGKSSPEPESAGSREQARSFTAALERGSGGLGWITAKVPFDPRTIWPTMVRLRVCGTVSGPGGTAAFRTSLFTVPGAEGGHFFLLVNRAMQQGAGAEVGTELTIRLEADLEERPAELPEELDALLDEAEGLRSWYGELSEYTRREIGKWISGVKSDEARVRRAEQMAERLLSTMEAEEKLPPLIEQAFQKRPKARRGWMQMTVAQRRAGLLAVFYYQTPEAREKRLAKLIDEAEKRVS